MGGDWMLLDHRTQQIPAECLAGLSGIVTSGRNLSSKAESVKKSAHPEVAFELFCMQSSAEFGDMP